MNKESLEKARNLIVFGLDRIQMDQMDNFPDIHLYKNTITEERKKLQRKAAAESQILLFC